MSPSVDFKLHEGKAPYLLLPPTDSCVTLEYSKYSLNEMDRWMMDKERYFKNDGSMLSATKSSSWLRKGALKVFIRLQVTFVKVKSR